SISMISRRRTAAVPTLLSSLPTNGQNLPGMEPPQGRKAHSNAGVPGLPPPLANTRDPPNHPPAHPAGSPEGLGVESALPLSYRSPPITDYFVQNFIPPSRKKPSQ